MAYHFFSDNEYAGPGPLQVLRFWDDGGYTLRKSNRKKMPLLKFHNSDILMKSEIATLKDAKMISEFWNNHYTGDDWRFSCETTDIERWLKSGFILVIRYDGKIVATFVCHYLNGVFSGKFNRQAGLLDGLVIDPKFRKQGLASYLLAAMDFHVYQMPNMENAILIWLREHPNRISALLQTPICVLEYSYAKIEELPNRLGKAQIASKDQIINTVNTIYDKQKQNFTLALQYTEDPDLYWYIYKNTLVGIANTHRIGKDDYKIYEVVFAANLYQPFFDDLQIAIEQASKMLPDNRSVIFMSSGKTRGNTCRPSSPWTYGTSGVLTAHVYNWMPPTFYNGDIFFPFSCI